jgi:hypothetical protein
MLGKTGMIVDEIREAAACFLNVCERFTARAHGVVHTDDMSGSGLDPETSLQTS